MFWSHFDINFIGQFPVSMCLFKAFIEIIILIISIQDQFGKSSYLWVLIPSSSIHLYFIIACTTITIALTSTYFITVRHSLSKYYTNSIQHSNSRMVQRNCWSFTIVVMPFENYFTKNRFCIILLLPLWMFRSIDMRYNFWIFSNRSLIIWISP